MTTISKEQSNESVEFINIEDIDIDAESRFRKSINDDDIQSLCDSIQEVGLIHPIVITKGDKKKLIAGHRRIEACKKLGWSKIPAWIVDIGEGEEEESKRKKGEFHENTIRKDFTASERVAIKRYFEPEEKEKARERMLAGKKPSPNLGEGSYEVGDKIAKYTGVSHDTLTKEEKIVKAVEENPTEE